MRRDDALWAAVCFAGGLVLLAVGAYTYRPTPGYLHAIAPDLPATVPAYVLAGPLLITCLGVAVRRTFPVAALVLGLVAFTADLLVGYSLGTIVIFTDNLYAATRYGPPRLGRWLLGITSAFAVVGGAVAWVVLHDLRYMAMIVVELGLVGTTPVSTGLIVRQSHEQAEAERARAEQVARLAELDRRAAVDAERTRMARELHDMIANHFSAIAIQSTAVLSRKDLDARTVQGVLESIRENSVQGMAEMRSMIELLRRDGEEAETTRRRVAEADVLVARARKAGLEVRLRVEGEARELPAAVDLAGYRIVQEALTNALKHGGGTVDLVIGYGPGILTLTADNPVGDARRGVVGSPTPERPSEVLPVSLPELSNLSDPSDPSGLSGLSEEVLHASLSKKETKAEEEPVSQAFSGTTPSARSTGLPALSRLSGPPGTVWSSFAGRGLPRRGQGSRGAERKSPRRGRRLSDSRREPYERGPRSSTDPGSGDTALVFPGAGAGIIGMRERAALLGGVFEAGPYDGGWRVHAALPTEEIS
ncbi:histidine kinase [Streptosporangium sp. NPDC051022]|uniref:histidine kinase n=1 Tax=Streptosporangium sp. NPDC051022 TaxID=3155752 RepID=UPI00342BEB65